MISAVILAAGQSERMGQPKALLLYQGRTFIEGILRSIAQSSVADTLVVLGHDREAIESRVRLPRVVFNDSYRRGMITSFQTGIRALPEDASAALFFLVDHPVVDVATIESLIASAGHKPIAVPVYQGRRGHPVLLGRAVFHEILDLPVSASANIVVRKDPARVLEVAIDSPGILIDVDTPQRLRNLNGREP